MAPKGNCKCIEKKRNYYLEENKSVFTPDPVFCPDFSPLTSPVGYLVHESIGKLVGVELDFTNSHLFSKLSTDDRQLLHHLKKEVNE